ncbi:splicing factor 3B subunit 2-like [Ptychodera flava]|uniref:splicing factor 3B subunit 2-like n=1 Tax=Ptychodera flava TaxID=63121 RepID=UPI00396A34B3
MIPTTTELRKLKVADLRERLSALGLPVGGIKNDLIERLRSHYIKQEEEGEDGHASESAPPAEEQTARPSDLDDEEALQSEEAQKLIESEQKRILEQQKERLAQRKQQQIEDEKLRQQQEAAAALLDEETRQKVMQQQQLIERQKLAEEQELLQQQQMAQQKMMEEKAKEEELLRQQQMALLIKQREEEAKIRQQQEMIRIQEEQQQQQQQQQQHHQQTRQPLLPTPSAPARPLLPTPPSQPGPPGPPQGPMSGPPPSMQQGGSHAPPPPPPPERQQPRPLLPTPERRDMGQPPQGMRQDNRPPPRGPPPPAQTREEEPPKRPVRLPQALEKVLAFKDERKQQIGTTEDEVLQKEVERKATVVPDVEVEELDTVDDEPVEMQPAEAESKESKNKKRKKKKKKRKERQREEQMRREAEMANREDEEEDNVDVEYVPEDLSAELKDPAFLQFHKIFEAFKLAETVKPEKEEKTKELKEKTDKKPEEEKEMSDSDMSDDDRVDDDKPKISKKKLRKLNRLSVAELKQLVSRPDVVEMHDVTAQDPKLLVNLKATRNTVPVPRHWCFKRKYLQGKRGIEKPPFELPDFIKKTGIMEMREALQEKEEQKTMKSKMREKVRPKMGKIDIDYQKLHDAFFKWQTKPKMTIHGDLYYEGKEFETRLKEKKPGELSDELRTALGMPIGPNAHKFPPPWLIAMQRYGPPPSYPNLKIPGLNAAIPESCSFGYHAGGWGKPPVDEAGKPLYGDVFGTNATDFNTPQEEEEIDRTLWGELESESEEEEEEEEESSSDEEKPDDTGLITPADGGLITPSGITSVPAGMETPEMIELRKKKIEDAMEQGGETPQLYTILPEKKAAVGAAMLGSTYTYDVAGAKKTQAAGGTDQGIAVALDPSELDLDTSAIEAKYEETVREQQGQLEKEDLSDMVAEHAAKQKKKRKAQSQEAKPSKKYKEFKF